MDCRARTVCLLDHFRNAPAEVRGGRFRQAPAVHSGTYLSEQAERLGLLRHCGHIPFLVQTAPDRRVHGPPESGGDAIDDANHAFFPRRARGGYGQRISRRPQVYLQSAFLAQDVFAFVKSTSDETFLLRYSSRVEVRREQDPDNAGLASPGDHRRACTRHHGPSGTHQERSLFRRRG